MASSISRIANMPHMALTDELRKETKGLHGKTDRLVQLGLFAVLDYKIYRQILLGFYYVFKTFEEEYERHLEGGDACNPWLRHTSSPELKRTSRFEQDLAFFYGEDWRSKVSPTGHVQEYMDHIREVSRHHPERLVAYPATLYLGLFFGGQITRSRIVKSGHFFPSPPKQRLGGEDDLGIAIFTFRAGEEKSKLDPNKVKEKLKDRLNSIPGVDSMDAETVAEREGIVEEAKEIFVRNMEIMAGVSGMRWVWGRWMMFGVVVAAVAIAVVQLMMGEGPRL